MRIDILTIFPKMFSAVLQESIIKRAQQKNMVQIFVHDLRNYTANKHRKVDDRPYGGGPGMILCCQPIFSAVRHILQEVKKEKTNKIKGKAKPQVILLCPQGKTFSQKMAKKLAKEKHLIFICGRYEGIDERVRTHLVNQEISIGDFVLSGGELPAMVVIDTLIRLIPGVLGDKNSLNFESFEGNLLEYPQFSRPANFEGMKVPSVLLSGNHALITAWRKAQALKRTKQRRPDLLKKLISKGE
ncbi:MAG: tRNA (guanosine(37)-N1)-methyltransferase TrmD [Candidatus Omnitrophica bacterium]|nr:tRNA (guanosine(37)-N1)-methyltransferase TrmD [Candidatus Omnitrophota bacterium]